MQYRYRPRAEALEQRRLLATLTVTSAADSIEADGSLTLREAVIAANANISVDGSPAGDVGADVIEFSASLSGSVIELTRGQMLVSESVSIIGLGAGQTIIDAKQQSRIFSLSDPDSSESYLIEGLTLRNGIADPISPTHPTRFGGAVYLDSVRQSRLLIRDSVIQGNQGDVGGGIYVRSGIAHITGSTLSGNQADFGGAIGVEDSNVTVTNSTVTGNSAAIVGGGIDHFARSQNAPSTVDLIHVTLLDNEAPLGRNIRSGASDGTAILRLANSIFFGQSTVSDLLADPASGTGTSQAISLGGNLADQSVSNSFLVSSDRRVLSVDGGFGPLADNGGPTQTRALHPLDFAVDQGVNANAVGPGDDLLMGTADDQPILTDQRGDGFQRLINGGSGLGTADAGAFEIQTTLDIPDELVVSNSADAFVRGTGPDLDDLTLREAINMSNLKVGANSISFAAAIEGQTIALTTGRTLFVFDQLDINGPGADKLTIDAENRTRHIVFQGQEDAGIKLTLSGLTFVGGNAPSAGGAIFAFRNHLIIKDMMFRNNDSPFSGGAIFARAMEFDLISSSFVDNQAVNNGGAVATLNATARITNVTASGNSAGNSAGAFHARLSNADLVSPTTILNSTFAENSAPEGADIVIRPDAGIEGTLTIGNSIIGSISQGTQSIVNVLSNSEPEGRLVSFGSNIFIDDSMTGLHAADLNETDALLAKRMIGVNGLAAHSTLPGSPARDAADPSLFPVDTFDLDGDNDVAELLPLDGLGQFRVVDLSNVGTDRFGDIGSYEIQETAIVSTANGALGLFFGDDNVVISSDNEPILVTPRADLSGIILRGTVGDDAIELADVSGLAPNGELYPLVTIDGNDGTDSLFFSSVYEQLPHHLSGRLELIRMDVGNVQVDNDWDSDFRMTPALLQVALADPTVPWKWFVDHTHAITDLDGWQYLGSLQEGAEFVRRIGSGTTELQIHGGIEWTNPINAFDVNGKDGVGPLDALIVINALALDVYFSGNTSVLRPPSDLDSFPNLFFDVNQDNQLTPRDALAVINELARQAAVASPEQIASTAATLQSTMPTGLAKKELSIDEYFRRFGEVPIV